MARLPRHLVVFVKAPRRGQVKSRLAAGIGADKALRFYRLTMARVLRRLARDRRWRTCLAVTPSRDRHARFWPLSLQRLDQGTGDLGRRMARVFAALPPGQAVIVGSDIPELRAHHVASAFRALGTHDAVFGPASDGGYWLVGLRGARPLPRTLFQRVRWSGPHALADSRASLPQSWSTAMVALLDDIDDADDYRRWQQDRNRQTVTPGTARGPRGLR